MIRLGRNVPLSGVLRTVTMPLCSAAVSIGNKIDARRADRDTVEALQRRLDELQAQNEALRTQLEIDEKDTHAKEPYGGIFTLSLFDAYTLLPAHTVSTDGRACPSSIIVDVGSRDGVTLHAPCVTAAGLVGYVTDVGIGWAKISTIGNAGFSVGIIDRSSGWNGVLCGRGTSSASAADACRLQYTNADSQFNTGDILYPSGLGSVFPAGIPVGLVNDVEQTVHNRLTYAGVTPLCDLTAQGLSTGTLWLMLGGNVASAEKTGGELP